MTATASDLLAAFDSLAPTEQKEVAVQILRRSTGPAEIPDQTFDELAAEIFASYDAEGAASAGK